LKKNIILKNYSFVAGRITNETQSSPSSWILTISADMNPV